MSQWLGSEELGENPFLLSALEKMKEGNNFVM
jgi:hypothetical protein